jgi:serine/threonine-protein kinase
MIPGMGHKDTVDEGAGVEVDGTGHLGEAFVERYQRLDLLGQGGMGEVHLCRDARIGRDVAMKVVREGNPSSASDREPRFLREARVQGQLEHPAVVPVYDLGRDPEGRPFFTMRRVVGVTLEQVIDRLGEGDAATASEYTRRKLLTAFTSLCLALDYAHERGVLHRDLKPANVMLGRFGEVYLLDWGLARRGPDDSGALAPSGDPVAEGATQEGAILGTPNYMAPEQVRGETDGLDRRADVYALGAILFELLTLEPLCRGDSLRAILNETLAGVEARASVRCPDREVPPELEAACVRATRPERDQRYPSARELCRAVERFLDGDRDLELRRQLAESHARAAYEAGEAAMAADGDLEARTHALRECGRALALDAQNRLALRTFLALLTRPPRRLPVEAEADFDRAEVESQRRAASAGFWAYASWFLYLPMVFLMGVRDWFLFVLPAPVWIAAALRSWLVARNPHPTGRMPFGLIALMTLAGASTAVIYGAFIVVPCIAVVNTISLMMSPDRTRRPAVLLAGVLTIVLPLLLEVAGAVPPTYRFENDSMLVTSLALHFPPVPAKLFLLVVNLAVVITAALMTARLRDTLTATGRQLHLHAWQLRQLVPDEASARVPAADPVDGCIILPDGQP